MSKNLNKFLVSIFALSVLVFGAFYNDASAGFWDWFNIKNTNKVNNETQQATAVANADTTYKWVNNGLVSEEDGRYTGNCGAKTLEETYTCNSSNVGDKVYDGTDRGNSYGDKGFNGVSHAWPIYEGENTATAKKYNYDSSSCNLDKRTGGTVNEWECKSSDGTTTTSSSSSASNSSSSVSSSSGTSSSSSSGSSQYSTTVKVVTKAAENITSNSATLKGTVNPNGEDVMYIFRYVKKGQRDSEKFTGWRLVSDDSSENSVSVNVSGLSSGTTYNFAIQAYSRTSKKFTWINNVMSFTTSSSSGASSSKGSGGTSSSSSSAEVEKYTLKVKISGAGKITSSGGSKNVNCKKTIDSNGKTDVEGICTVKIEKGDSVTLSSLTPNTKYAFAIWGDDCRTAQSATSCTIRMTKDKTVSATFNKKATEASVTISVIKTGSGDGEVVTIYNTGSNSGKEDGRINCGTDCSENFETNCENAGRDQRLQCGSVYFKAIPEKGSTFGGWSENCSTFEKKTEKSLGESECYVYLDGGRQITARFNGGDHDLKIRISGKGTVVSTDNKIKCGTNNSNCSHTYNNYGSEETVTLKVTPDKDKGYSSVDHDDDLTCSGNIKNNGYLNCKVKMTEDRNLKFTFKKSETSSSSKSSSASYSSDSNSSSDSSDDDSISSTVSIKNVGTGMGYVHVYLFKEGKNSGIKTCRLGVGSTCEITQDSNSYLRLWAKPYQSSFGSWESGCGSTQKAGVDGDMCNLRVSSSGNSVNVRFTKSSSSSSSSDTTSSSSISSASTNTSSSSSAKSSSSASSSASLTAKTGSASYITSNSASLTGTINPQGENVYVYFQYRKESESSSATKTTVRTSTDNKTNDVISTHKVSDLSSGTKYVYRFYAYSYTSGKTFQGDLKSFTTLTSSSGSSSSGIQSQTTSSASTIISRSSSSSKSASSSSKSSSKSSSSSPSAYLLVVSKVGNGIGSVIAPGINCPSDCAENYPAKSTITLIAVPAQGSVFAGWNGCNTSNGTVCAVSMSSPRSVTANFIKP